VQSLLQCGFARQRDYRSPPLSPFSSFSSSSLLLIRVSPFFPSSFSHLGQRAEWKRSKPAAKRLYYRFQLPSPWALFFSFSLFPPPFSLQALFFFPSFSLLLALRQLRWYSPDFHIVATRLSMKRDMTASPPLLSLSSFFFFLFCLFLFLFFSWSRAAEIATDDLKSELQPRLPS